MSGSANVLYEDGINVKKDLVKDEENRFIMEGDTHSPFTLVVSFNLKGEVVTAQFDSAEVPHKH
ncbi:MAG: hypothetical protein M3Q97_00230 [Bacteroidota bacterium]|nr:hypothetical protein [Bacteroidota bacterium]